MFVCSCICLIGCQMSTQQFRITIWNTFIGLIGVFVLKVHHFTNHLCLFLICCYPSKRNSFPSHYRPIRNYFSLFNHSNYHLVDVHVKMGSSTEYFKNHCHLVNCSTIFKVISRSLS